MFRCHVCGSNKAVETSVNEVFIIDENPVFVEHIPAMVCESCGESVFSRETTEKIRRMLHGEGKPTKTICMDVYAYT